ncbi:hypothetical protein MKC73_01255 [[Clostridium] innocuum]|nr:hypothetical protein [[Clostridium] innocuum]
MNAEDLSPILQSARDAYTQLSDIGVRKEKLEPFQRLMRGCEELIRKEAAAKEKQRTGIERARKEGVSLGRPRTPCSKRFLNLVYLQSKSMITAADAAEQLGIGRTTYNHMKVRYREEIERWKKQER